MNVAILGAGPVAAYCLMACRDMDLEPIIVAKQKTTTPYGAVWFRWIPQSIDIFQKQEINVVPMGTAEKYIEKQWGNQVEVSGYSSSFPKAKYITLGYDPAPILEYVWKDVLLTSREIDSDKDILDLSKYFDLVFQTFPSFASREANQKYTIEIPTKKVQGLAGADNFIYYSGLDNDIVRLSFLFGSVYYEFVRGCDISDKSGISGKFIDIHPDAPVWSEKISSNVIPIGRYAEWNRHMLAHEAYNKATEALTNL